MGNPLTENAVAGPDVHPAATANFDCTLSEWGMGAGRLVEAVDSVFGLSSKTPARQAHPAMIKKPSGKRPGATSAELA
jgi:hypothetical protein